MHIDRRSRVATLVFVPLMLLGCDDGTRDEQDSSAANMGPMSLRLGAPITTVPEIPASDHGTFVPIPGVRDVEVTVLSGKAMTFRSERTLVTFENGLICGVRVIPFTRDLSTGEALALTKQVASEFEDIRDDNRFWAALRRCDISHPKCDDTFTLRAKSSCGSTLFVHWLPMSEDGWYVSFGFNAPALFGITD